MDCKVQKLLISHTLLPFNPLDSQGNYIYIFIHHNMIERTE